MGVMIDEVVEQLDEAFLVISNLHNQFYGQALSGVRTSTKRAVADCSALCCCCFSCAAVLAALFGWSESSLLSSSLAPPEAL